MEKAQFISSSQLAAIVSEPSSSCDTGTKPTVVFLNAGIVHRIGPSRLHVKFARALADKGIRSIRFDHSGIGDSAARRGTEEFMQAAVAEVSAVIDTVESRFDSDRIVLFGLCSGADVGFEAAVVDQRVKGLIQLDPWFYPTTKGRMIHFKNHYGPQLLNPQSWRRFARNRLHALVERKARKSELDEWFSKPEYIRVTPPRAHVLDGLQTLLARDTRVMSVFSGTTAFGIYGYEDQFVDSFPELDLSKHVTVQHYPRASHMFTDLDHQELLRKKTFSWMQDHGFL